MRGPTATRRSARRSRATAAVGGGRGLVARASRRFLYPVSAGLAARFGDAGEAGLARIEASLRHHFYGTAPPGFLDSPEGRRHLEGHRIRRLQNDRRRVVPWLDAARGLDGSRVLEIGCGTGSSTVALAEQGALVTAVDVARPHLEVARERCAAYGVKPRLLEINATEVAERLAGERFDFVVFFAALEHMTHEERRIAMGNTWRMLAPGGLWVVVETPNRLHFYDGHTANLPFFHWLPDDVAFDYRHHSPRAACRDFQRGRGRTPESLRRFQRLGRSVSYHEFELALGPLEELEVVSSLGRYSPGLRALRRIQRVTTLAGRYQALLSRVRPDLHPAFLEPWLNLILRRR